MMKWGRRAWLSHVLMVMCGGCLIENPAYDGPLPGASTSTTELAPDTTTTTTTTTTTLAVTSSGTTTSTTTGDGPTSTSSTATSESLDSTTGIESPMVVGHYDPDRCLEPLWCFAAEDVWNGLPGEIRGAECFDVPLAPPFRVRRIDYRLVAVRDEPHVRFEVRSGDLTQVLYTSESLVLPVTAGSLILDEDVQPVVDEARFCVGFVGGDMKSSIGFAVDDSAPPPPQQSYLGSNTCNVPGLRDVDALMPEPRPHGAWCLGAELVAL